MIGRGLARFVDLSAFNALLELVLSFGTLYDDLLGISQWFMDFLAGPESFVLVVTNPCQQRIDDTARFIKYLHGIGVSVDGIVVNRVFQWRTRPPSGSLRTEVFKDLASEPELRFYAREAVDTAIHKLTRALQWFEEVRQAQEAQIRRLVELFPEIAVSVLPARETDVAGPDDLLGLIRDWALYSGSSAEHD
jgi:anion-transporting  ArsA/GET3 family ATPase